MHNSESHLVEALQGLLDFHQGRVGDANFNLLVLSLSTQPVPHHSAGIAGKSQTHILVKNNWEAQSTNDGLSNTNVFLEESDQHKSPHSRGEVSRWIVLTAIELNSRQLLKGRGGGLRYSMDRYSQPVMKATCFHPFCVCFHFVWGSWSNHAALLWGPCDRKDVMSYSAERCCWTNKYPKEQSWGKLCFFPQVSLGGNGLKLKCLGPDQWELNEYSSPSPTDISSHCQHCTTP